MDAKEFLTRHVLPPSDKEWLRSRELAQTLQDLGHWVEPEDVRVTRYLEPKLGMKRQFDEAMQALARINLRLVLRPASVAMLRTSSLEFEDVFQHGALGLLRATVKYSSSYGTQFSTYAMSWIKQNIGRAVRMNESLIRWNASTVVFAKGGQAQDARFSIGPIRRDVVDRLAFARSGDSSIPLDIYAREVRHRVRAAIETLREKEKLVVTLRYGFGDTAPMTLNEISEFLGVTPERIRQIQLKAEERLRPRLKEFERDGIV